MMDREGKPAHRIHQRELLCHHDGVKRQETERRKLVLEAALFLCGKRAADVFPCREDRRRNPHNAARTELKLNTGPFLSPSVKL